MIERLHARWTQDMQALGLDPPAALPALHTILAAYASDTRHYHGLGHLDALHHVLDRLSTAGPGSAARLAVWWHDLVYDPLSGDNEDRSADICEQELKDLGVGQARIDETCRLIRATKAHWDSGSHGEGDAFLDADIAILGAPSSIYDTYAVNVRREYQMVPDILFRAGRSRFLESALARQELFRTAPFQQAFDAQARINMARELEGFQAK